MPNFNEVMRKEEVVLTNIDRTIGRLQARQKLAECEVEEQVSKKAVRLLEATRCEVVRVIECLVNIQCNVSKVINRAIGQFKFMEEIASCEVEEDIYKDTRACLDIILKDYVNTKQKLPKMWMVCEVIPV